MEKEIGGYFGLERKTESVEFYSNLIHLNSARNALVYLVKAKGIKKVYIPYYLCESVSNVMKRENISFDYYHVDNHFHPIFDKELNEDEYLYIVNYYGQLNEEVIVKYKKKYKNIILDNIHAFFQKPLPGIDTLYSCRKFFGVPDGGYLSSDCQTIHLDKDDSSERMKHLIGRNKDGASAHYLDFKENEKKFVGLPLMLMSDITRDILQGIDYQYVKNQRETNYKELDKRLSTYNGLKPLFNCGPYTYPFYYKKGNEMRSYLHSHNIYVSKLWPNVKDVPEVDCVDNILPIPCDQRYNIDDMDYIADLIINYINKNK